MVGRRGGGTPAGVKLKWSLDVPQPRLQAEPHSSQPCGNTSDLRPITLFIFFIFKFNFGHDASIYAKTGWELVEF
jgi:hypothetical protein